MNPLTITAELISGIAHASPWTISLDGLLASQLWADRKRATGTQHALSETNPPDLELPLAKCHANPQWWHWAATCGWPNNPTGTPEIRYWETHLDHRHCELAAAELPQHLHDSSGRWKAFWMPLPVTVAESLTWRAVGDPEAIWALLEPIQSIGKKRSQGEGRVKRWLITVDDTLDHFSAGHLSPTGALARPCPPECLTSHAAAHGGEGYAAIRPPHMHPSRKTDVLLPAPW